MPEIFLRQRLQSLMRHNKTGRLLVKMLGQDKKAYDFYTEVRGTNKQRLNPKLHNKKFSWLRA